LKRGPHKLPFKLLATCQAAMAGRGIGICSKLDRPVSYDSAESRTQFTVSIDSTLSSIMSLGQ
jgi:hypothetical protein